MYKCNKETEAINIKVNARHGILGGSEGRKGKGNDIIYFKSKDT